MSDIEQFEGRLAELQGERAGVDVQMSSEDLTGLVAEWMRIARAQSAGSSRLVLGAPASGETLGQVLAEDRLDDDGLAGRLIARLEAQGFGRVSERAKKSKLGKLDGEIEKVKAELHTARKNAAIAELEKEFAAA